MKFVEGMGGNVFAHASSGGTKSRCTLTPQCEGVVSAGVGVSVPSDPLAIRARWFGRSLSGSLALEGDIDVCPAHEGVSIRVVGHPCDFPGASDERM